MQTFTIRQVVVDNDPTSDSITIGFGETSCPDTAGLILQSARVFDERDIAHGMNTYCLSTSNGATVYGGVERVTMRGHQLGIVLSSIAADALNIDKEVMLNLDVSESTIARLKEALRAVFHAGLQQPVLEGL